jgi:hypothetical protein
MHISVAKQGKVGIQVGCGMHLEIVKELVEAAIDAEVRFHKLPKFHFVLLGKLANLLEDNGWNVILEHKIRFDTVIRRRNQLRRNVRGIIDLTATRNNERNIAIEFDTTRLLKMRSIEKLLQYDAVGLGITYARKNEESYSRVIQAMAERKPWTCFEFWLLEIRPLTVSHFIRNGTPFYQKWELNTDYEWQNLVLPTDISKQIETPQTFSCPKCGGLMTDPGSYICSTCYESNPKRSRRRRTRRR